VQHTHHGWKLTPKLVAGLRGKVLRSEFRVQSFKIWAPDILGSIGFVRVVFGVSVGSVGLNLGSIWLCFFKETQ
jgi:hypothetical protein